MEALAGFLLAIIAALVVIQLSPFRIKIKSPEEKAADQVIDNLQSNFEKELEEAQS